MKSALIAAAAIVSLTLLSGLPTPQDVSKALSWAVLPVIMPVTTVSSGRVPVV